MKKNHLIFLSILLFTLHLKSYGQEFSKGVNDFIEIQDSIVLLKNAVLIDGTGGKIRTHQDILLINNQISAIGNSGE